MPNVQISSFVANHEGKDKERIMGVYQSKGQKVSVSEKELSYGKKECKRNCLVNTLSSLKISSENGFPPLFAITESTWNNNC